jgi:hypothetical protein
MIMDRLQRENEELNCRGKHTPHRELDDKDSKINVEACPRCGGQLKELEDVRVRYEEEIIPIPLFVIKYLFFHCFALLMLFGFNE